MSAISPLPDLHRPVEAAVHPDPTLLRDLYELTKPRMNMLVVLTTLLGCYAAPHPLGMNWLLIVNTVIATALTAASAGVLNQYVEREYDGQMRRTAQRALPAGRIRSTFRVLALGVLLGTTGVRLPRPGSQSPDRMLGGTTLASYVFIYTPMKRWT